MLSGLLCYMEKRYSCISINLCCCKYYKLRFQLEQSSSANAGGFLNENVSSGHMYIMKLKFSIDIYHL